MSSETTLSARALASRRNGAKSRGPKTAAGKARSARNAFKHGLCAKKLLVLPEEDATEFRELEAALLTELAPEGPLQSVLAQRIVSAAWRLRRADRIEAEIFEERRFADGELGLSVIRDGNSTRSFETVMRYRNAALSELLRAQKTLQALQAPQRAEARADAAPATRRRSRPPRAPNEPQHRGETAAGRSAGPGQESPHPSRPPDHPASPAMAVRTTERTQESEPKQKLDVRTGPQSGALDRSPGRVAPRS